MEHQYRRGIYRPKAQRLSISLAPLVAQRSLLFRVKADLATKTHYGELTPTEESDSASTSASASQSPALFVVTASASARLISAALSALSTCSVYSQESWQGASPFAPAPAAAPARAHAALLLDVDDTRRHAIAFSPSVQWEALSDDAESVDMADVVEAGVQTPLLSAGASAVAVVPADGIFSSREGKDLQVNTKAHLRLSTSSSILSPFFRGGIPSLSLELTPVKVSEIKEAEVAPTAPSKIRASAAKRISRHAKAFGKAMGHLSMPPSSSSKKDGLTTTMSKDIISRRQTTAMVITHLHLGKFADYKLPDIVIPRLSPIASSLPDNTVCTQSQSIPVRPRPPRSIRPPPTTTNSSSNTIQNQTHGQRSTTPPPPIAVPATITAARKGHRRYNSSPAVPHFNVSEFKGWNRADMPPMPAMPPRSELEKFRLGSAPPRPPRSLARGVDGAVAAADSVMRRRVRAATVDC
ncbi:hypothetical protein CVT25_003527 [Psilocybe cyanescens]|uniref:Uncharacterized protein n=1 Tax=Psilocybe cyanescens TaxID=93625 RepID=A0A409XQQ8_PSICY|nr:hypothetical protein CVT25_003527 [Psilocybe cyanescens]